MKVPPTTPCKVPLRIFLLDPTQVPNKLLSFSCGASGWIHHEWRAMSCVLACAHMCIFVDQHVPIYYVVHINGLTCDLVLGFARSGCFRGSSNSSKHVNNRRLDTKLRPNPRNQQNITSSPKATQFRRSTFAPLLLPPSPCSLQTRFL